jgi:hypothetical protein
MMRASTPAQQQATRARTLAQQWQRHLRINSGDNTIMRRVATAIATTAKMPVHQQCQCHHGKGNNANDGKEGCTLMMTMTSYCARDRGWIVVRGASAIVGLVKA